MKHCLVVFLVQK